MKNYPYIKPYKNDKQKLSFLYILLHKGIIMEKKNGNILNDNVDKVLCNINFLGNITDDIKNKVGKFLEYDGINYLEDIKKLENVYGENFLKLFLFVCDEADIWKNVLILGHRESFEYILGRCFGMLSLIDSWSDFDTEYLLFTDLIKKRVAIILSDEQNKDIKNFADCQGTSHRKFLMNILKQVKSKEKMTLHDFNQNEFGFYMYTIKGGEIIKDTALKNMFAPDNYCNPKKFGMNEWIHIFDSILHAFPLCKREFCFQILKGFYANLSSLDTKFFLLKKKNFCEL